MNLRVGIVEDERQIREHIFALINGSSGFECVGSFESGESAITKIPTLNIDTVLMDINLPERSGIECVSVLKPLCPNTQFIMFTVLEDSSLVFEALKAGAVGYLTKTTQPAKILEALMDAHNGGSPMSSQIARKVVASFHAQQNIELQNLTSRENEILDYLSKGYRYKEIANSLFLSTETVRTHIRNIYEKLHVNSRMDAVNKAFKKI